jgi:hypothetical protein
MNYIRNELCRLHRRSNGHAGLINTSYHMQNIYLLTKSVEDVQLVPTSGTSCTGTLALFMSFVWQNFWIEADKYIAIAATGYGEMLREVKWLILFVDNRSHLIPRMQKDIEEYEDNPNLTVMILSLDQMIYKNSKSSHCKACNLENNENYHK